MTDDLKKEIARLAGVLNEPGAITDFGCSESQIDKMKEKSKQIESNKPVYVVKDWMIWDVQPPPQLNESNVLVIKGSTIIFDELERFPVGGWVRTAAMINIYDNCIFATGNTHYILVGRGTRKIVALDDALRFL